MVSHGLIFSFKCGKHFDTGKVAGGRPVRQATIAGQPRDESAWVGQG